MELGPHAGYILASYAMTALIVGAFVGRAVLGQRAQMRALADLEARGSGRRSAAPAQSL